MLTATLTTGIGVAATLVVAWCFHYLATRDAKPTYYIHNEVLVDVPEQVRDRVAVKVRGFGETRRVLFSTRVIFWNAGRKAIRKSHCVQDAPLTIAVDKGRILSATIECTSNEANKVVVSKKRDNSTAVVSFDFLNARDHVEVHVLHDSVSMPNVTASYVDASLTKCTNPPKPINSPGWWFAGFVFAHSWAWITFIQLALFEAGIPFDEHRKVAPITILVFSLMGTLSFAMWLTVTFVWWLRKFRFPISDAVFHPPNEYSLATARLRSTIDQLQLAINEKTNIEASESTDE